MTNDVRDRMLVEIQRILDVMPRMHDDLQIRTRRMASNRIIVTVYVRGGFKQKFRVLVQEIAVDARD